MAGQELTAAQTAAAPTVQGLPSNHTLILIDHNSVTLNYVHWISTDPTVPYQGPAPPPGSAPIHNYVFYVVPITSIPSLTGRIASKLPNKNYEITRFTVRPPLNTSRQAPVV